jgi:hypothetical protein
MSKSLIGDMIADIIDDALAVAVGSEGEEGATRELMVNSSGIVPLRTGISPHHDFIICARDFSPHTSRRIYPTSSSYVASMDLSASV